MYRNILLGELQDGIVRHINRAEVAWVNPTFLVAKKDGGARKILDCSVLNEYMMDRSFQMEDVRVIRQLAQTSDWATTLDIASAYSHVAVDRGLQPFLSFLFDGQWFCYMGMPFGLKCAPRIFTLLMRKVIQYLRETLGVRIVPYIDDLLILAHSREEAEVLTDRVLTELTSLGWTISWEKCKLTPTQRIEFVGWEFDFAKMTFRTTQARKCKLMSKLRDWVHWCRARRRVPVRQLAELVGSLNFLRLQHVSASLYLTHMKNVLTRVTKTYGWDARVTLTPLLTGEIKWWMKALAHNTPAHLREGQPNATLVTDASPWGWGASLQREREETLRLWEVWNEEDSHLSSNHREFLAILTALTRVRVELGKCRVIRILTDNSAAAFNIRRWRGVQTRIPALRQLWNLCVGMEWTLIPQHLPGSANGEADALSRMGGSSEFYLTMQARDRVFRMMSPRPTLDVFASRATHVLRRYSTLDRSDGEALAIDGLQVDWRDEVLWLHPPLNLILTTLTRVQQTGAKGAILVPDWKGQPWYPLLRQLSKESVTLGPYCETMILTPEMQQRDWRLPPGNAQVHFLGTRTMEGRTCSTS
jgi:ribonuclease HI